MISILMHIQCLHITIYIYHFFIYIYNIIYHILLNIYIYMYNDAYHSIYSNQKEVETHLVMLNPWDGRPIGQVLEMQQSKQQAEPEVDAKDGG